MSNYIILTPFFPSSKSFRGTYLLDQIKSIKKNSSLKVKVIIFSSFFERNSGNYSIEGIDCITFKIFDLPSFIIPGVFNSLNFKRFNQFLLINKITISSTTIIHGHINYPSSSFLYYLKNKYNSFTILQHHGLDILQKKTGIFLPLFKKFQNNLIYKRTKFYYESIDLIVVVSQRMKSELLSIYTNLNPKIYVSINGVDSSKFYKKQNPKMTSKFIIGCIGNFWKLKDQITLLRAVNRLYIKGFDNIQIIFVGTGITLSKCKEFAKKNHIDTKFIDSVKHNELLNFYNNIDLFVLPSYYEAFGCVYLEAMACGVPFIAVKNQGIEDVIEESFKKLYLMEERNDLELSYLIEQHFTKKNIQPFNPSFEINKVTIKLLNHIYQLK